MFIHTVAEDAAKGAVADIYDSCRDATGRLPNYARAFSHRPGVMAAWETLIGEIRSGMDARRYELVTLAAARALKSSYCMLAHGMVLLDGHFDADELETVARHPEHPPLTGVEIAIMHFAEKIALDATSVTPFDIDGLKAHGLSDTEIFDIASAAAARCFFAKTLDALGAHPDAHYADLDAKLRNALIVGRPVDVRG